MTRRFTVDGDHGGGATPGSSNRVVTMAGCLAVVVAQMCITVLAPINGEIQTALGASGTQLTWLTAAAIVPTAILELNFGLLGDMFGRKRLIVGGALVAAAGACLATAAGSVPVLAAGLTVMGLGAAALFPSTLALVAESAPTPEERSRALARWSLSVAFGAVISPLFSGAIAEQWPVRFAFVPIIVLGLVSAAVSVAFVRDGTTRLERGLDWPGQILVAVGLLALIYAVVQGSEEGFSRVDIVAGFVVAAACLVLFAVVELRSAHPMFEVRLLRIPAFAAAAAAGLVGMLGFIGTAYAVSIKLGPIAHHGPLYIALPFVLIQAVPLLMTPVLPRLLHRVAARTLLVTGLLVLAAGQAWLIALPDGETGLVAMAGPILCMGVGFIVMFSSLTAAAVNSVPHRFIGMASAATSLVRETGQALGPAIIAAVAFAQAESLVAAKTGDLNLPPQQAGVVEAVTREGGTLALANADLGPLSKIVAPLARASLEQGFDVGLAVCVAASVLAALAVALLLRAPGGADAPVPEPAAAADAQ
jgi:MFS family permease